MVSIGNNNNKVALLNNIVLNVYTCDVQWFIAYKTILNENCLSAI